MLLDDRVKKKKSEPVLKNVTGLTVGCVLGCLSEPCSSYGLAFHHPTVFSQNYAQWSTQMAENVTF